LIPECSSCGFVLDLGTWIIAQALKASDLVGLLFSSQSYGDVQKTEWMVSLGLTIISWVMVSTIFNFHPENWGNDPIWPIFFKT